MPRPEWVAVTSSDRPAPWEHAKRAPPPAFPRGKWHACFGDCERPATATPTAPLTRKDKQSETLANRGSSGAGGAGRDAPNSSRAGTCSATALASARAGEAAPCVPRKGGPDAVGKVAPRRQTRCAPRVSACVCPRSIPGTRPRCEFRSVPLASSARLAGRELDLGSYSPRRSRRSAASCLPNFLAHPAGLLSNSASRGVGSAPPSSSASMASRCPCWAAR